MNEQSTVETVGADQNVREVFKIGNRVRVKTNARGTVWEFGKIVHFNEQGEAILNYGTSYAPIFGLHLPVPVSHLEYPYSECAPDAGVC
jgi:hypothetical protein